MAKHHRASRKSRKHATHKRKQTQKRKMSHKRKQTRRVGGDALRGAPTSYSLAGDWSSRMSLGQGADYFKYHEGQHGGAAAPFATIGTPLISSEMTGPAMTHSLNKALSDVAGLRDPPYDQMAPPAAPMQKGGRKRAAKSQKRKDRKRRQTRRRGGAVLGFAPVAAPGMLLPNEHAYSQAGLNPDYRGAAVEYTVAKVRDQV